MSFRPTQIFTAMFVLGLLLASSAFGQGETPLRVPEPQALPQSGTSVYVATPPSRANFTTAAFGVKAPFKADISKEARAQAILAIPQQKLNETAQRKVQKVLSDISMYRRLPIQVMPCEEELFTFVTRHPDVVTNLWQLMNASKIQVKELGAERFYLEDGAGTRGVIECLYRSERYVLIYVVGTYEGVPFPNKVKGNGLLILQQVPTVNAEGQPQLAVRLDAFMHIDNAGVDRLVRSFQNLVGRVADHNFNQTVTFMSVLSRTVCYNGDGVKRLSERLDQVQPQVRKEFGDMAVRISTRIENELQSRNSGDLPVPVELSATP